MAYTVLARKYRSQTFDEVIGQEAISQTLKNAIRTGRIAHAYLFTGTRGVGKTTMARILAKALNCLEFDGPTETPCCKCDSCVAINLGEDIDVIEIDGASNNSVDEVRRLRENAIYRPARSRFKIYIIDEVHMLSTSAFNALLKILEEPPEHVKFIFATTEPNKVIPTIQSRCQRFDFNNISPNLIAEQLRRILKSEKIKYDEDVISPLARMANGSMRDALSLLDRLISTGQQPLTYELMEKYLGQPSSKKIACLIEKIASANPTETLKATGELLDGGLSELQIVDALIEFMRDIMVAKSTGDDSQVVILTPQQRQLIAGLADKFDIEALIYNITTLERMRWQIKNSETARALLEAVLLRLTLSEHFMNIAQILEHQTKSEKPQVKKNVKLKNSNHSSPVSVQSGDPAPAATEQVISEHLILNDINSIRANWPKLISFIETKMGGATAGLLNKAEPSGFDNGTLTLLFDESSRISRDICQSNGRLEKIQAVLSEYFSQPVNLKLKLKKQPAPSSSGEPTEDKSASGRRNGLVTDPAVRTVLAGLGGRIIKIEQTDSNDL